MRSLCEEKADLTNAIISKDPQACEKLPDGSKVTCKDQLYTMMAQEKQDKAACKNIADSSLEEGCISEIENLKLQEQQASIVK
jgi:hypothetical protein